MVSTLLLVIIFTGSSSHPHPIRVLEVHVNGIRGRFIHITESKIHISYLKNLDSTLILSSIIFTCRPFQPSSISLLRVYFSITSPFEVNKFQNNSLDVSSNGSFSFIISMGTHFLISFQPYDNGDSTWI